MGLDANRFVKSHKIEKEFICSICRDVIHIPKQINSSCEHIFCYYCISFRVEKDKNLKCPNDSNSIEEPCFKNPSRYWLNNYNKLKMKCYFIVNGCKAVVDLEDIDKHERSCEHNPNALVICKEGCAAEIPRKALESHKCVTYLKGLIDDLALSRPQSQSPQFCGSIYDEINSIKNQIRDLKKRLDETIDRLNESLPKNSNFSTRRELTQSTYSNKSLLDIDSSENAPPVKPRRIDASILQSTKVIQPKFYDSSNLH